MYKQKVIVVRNPADILRELAEARKASKDFQGYRAVKFLEKELESVLAPSIAA